MLNILSYYYHKILGRFVECAGLYRLDLSNFRNDMQISSNNDFEFYMPTKSDTKLLIQHYNYQSSRNAIIKTRYELGNYICFSYRDKRNGRLAYTRWLCLGKFYSDYLKKDLNFNKNETFTLDSFTHPDYRGLGLHRRMNVEMLQWLKKNTDYQFVFMVIKCFIPHLHKVVKDLGYVKTETKIYFKQGSIKQFLKNISKKVF